MVEHNDKTIFVLDHTPYFGISAESYVDFECVLKSKGSPAPPISKSLWTLAVESSVEYCRIVWDLYPAGKLIRFVISDTAAHIVNTWATSTQNVSHVLNAMAMVGVPRNITQTTEFTVIHGLRAAIEALSEPNEAQKEMQQTKNENNKAIQNRGRVICITSARDNNSMKSLEDIFQTVLMQQNQAAALSKDLLKIDHCHLIIINLFPATVETFVTNRAVMDVSPLLKSEIHSTKANLISNKLTHLIMPHYDLASTTVTGIPMKEEQNSSSSANYDVEIFHHSRSHSVFMNSELVLPRNLKEGSEYETVTLKWCTPKAGSAEMAPCLAQHRVTPVDVQSRPSSCLINFLLNGRSVLLEMPRKSGGKVNSHLLSAHGGEIFIHSLTYSTRSCLEDMPSISEGCGGKVINYRIPDFVQMSQLLKLVPLKPSPDRIPDENLGKMRNKIAKHTKYFPLTFGSTIVYNIRQFVEPLLVLIQKDELLEEDIINCQQCIYQLITLETRNESLALHNNQRIKGSKRDEQFRLMWNEIDMIVATSGKSSGHKILQQFLKDLKAKKFDKSGEKIDIDVKMEIDTDIMPRATIVIRTSTDSPMSPPPTENVSSRFKKSSKTTLSLFDIVMAKERAINSKRIDFSGRLANPVGQIAKLYPNFGNPKEITADTK